ncbi:hypothetical protein CMI37_39525 [Candidatus Pacearchaeota archaeon]|nr:hypothetical protein [Candidatus Pacearchaeota archaeon]
MKLTKSRLKRLIKEELQKVLMQEQCPPGMTQQGNQCVGQPGAYKKPTITQTSQGAPIEMPTPDRALGPQAYKRAMNIPLCTLGWSIREFQLMWEKGAGGRWSAKQLASSARGTNGHAFGLSKLAGTGKPMSKQDCIKLNTPRAGHRLDPTLGSGR